jgi:stage II sporulation protein Q
MEKRRLKKSVVYLLYGLGFVLLVGVAFTIENVFTKKTLDDKLTYVSKTVFDKVIPVVATDYKIIRPINKSEIQVIYGYYDYKSDDENQRNSILVYDKTYMQSSGITYGYSESFDVVSILDGKVITVKQDELLGNIVEIEHNNGIISIYQSLDSVNVKVNDTIKQGTIIGKSGKNNLNKTTEYCLYFEMIVNGNLVNPNNYYDKTVDEI